MDRQPIATVTSAASLERGSTVEASIRETVEVNLRGDIANIESTSTTVTSQRAAENIERIRNSATRKESKVTRILATSKPGRSRDDQEERNQSSSAVRNVSFEEVEDLTVLPLQEEMSGTDLMLNRTRSALITSLSAASGAANAAIRTFNRSEDDVEVDEEVAQTQHFATAASILEGEARRCVVTNTQCRVQLMVAMSYLSAFY